MRRPECGWAAAVVRLAALDYRLSVENEMIDDDRCFVTNPRAIVAFFCTVIIGQLYATYPASVQYQRVSKFTLYI
ncbi:hypothetical protein BDW72DRAFT_188052 [Aspergillus terricola var. indicus]